MLTNNEVIILFIPAFIIKADVMYFMQCMTAQGQHVVL